MPPAPNRFGQYALLERLGRGGMGETWKARRADLPGAPVVVIKRMLEDLAGDPGQVEAFVNEAHLTATLKHPNIAEVLDFGRAQGEYFFALELVHGCTIDALLRAAEARGLKTLPVPVACFIAASVLRGLHHAHTRTGADGQPLRLVHRDISPDNVLVGFDGQVKIIDFGVAKARLPHRSETQVGRVKGKIHYFSPEQARAEPLDGRSDVFAVGVMLYRMTCGQLPFEGAGMEVAFRMLKGDYAPPHVANPALPTPLDNAINRALEVSQERRFQTAALMETALRQVLDAVAPRFGQDSLRSFVQWAFFDTLAAEGVTTDINPADLAQISRWVDESSARQKRPGFTPADPRARGATELARPGVGPPRSPPASRWALALGALGLFGLGMGVTAALLLRQPTPEPPAESLPPRVVAFSRVQAVYGELEQLDPAIPTELTERLKRLQRDRLSPGADDPRYLEDCARLEVDLGAALATAREHRAQAVLRAAQAADAGERSDAGRPPGQNFDVVVVDLSSAHRLQLTRARHNLSKLSYGDDPNRKWRGKVPLSIKLKAKGGSTFAQVTFDIPTVGHRTIRAIELPHPAGLEFAVGVRLIDFRPLQQVRADAPVPRGQLVDPLKGALDLVGVCGDREDGRFVELRGVAGHSWVEFARGAPAGDDTWAVVAHCDGKTLGANDRPARFASPRRCAVALVGTEDAPPEGEVVISAGPRR